MIKLEINKSIWRRFLSLSEKMEDQQEAKRMEMDDDLEESDIAENSSSSHTSLCSSIIHQLYLDEKTADVYFEFGDGIERVPAHKNILSTGSRVFETMFGSLPEGDEVTIGNGNSSAFKEFLQFFYLDEVAMTSENIVEVMNYLREYRIEGCMPKCVDFLKDTTTNNDVCTIYQLALQFNLDNLKTFCERKISAFAEDVLTTDDFLNCDENVFKSIVQMDSLICDEVNVFDACLEWAKKSCEKKNLDAGKVRNLRAQLKESLFSIHFRRMKFKDFASRNAKYFQLFSPAETRDILQIIANKDFKSDMFTTKPFSNEIFACADGKETFECSLYGFLRDGNIWRRVSRQHSFLLASNKALLLNKIKFARVRNPAHSRVITPLIRFTLFRIKIDGKDTTEPLFNREFRLRSDKNVFFEFHRPILICPTSLYEISFSNDSQLEVPKIQYGTIEHDDVRVEFFELFSDEMNVNSFGLVDAMFFSRI